MADRYQPGASLLSFLNPSNRYYVDRNWNTPAALEDVKAELASDLAANKKDPAEIITAPGEKGLGVEEVAAPAQPPGAPEVPATIADAVAPGSTEAVAIPAAAEAAAKGADAVIVGDMNTVAPETVAGATVLNDNSMTAADVKADVDVLKAVADTSNVLPGVDANVNTAVKADAVANAAVTDAVTDPNAAAQVVAAATADTPAQVAAPVVDVTAPVGDAAPAAAPADAPAAAPKEGYCPCMASRLAQKIKVKDNVPEQAKDAVESFCTRESFIQTLGPSDIIADATNIGNKLKAYLTGAGKPVKSGVEKFCDNQWHLISVTIIMVIGMTIICIFGLGSLGLIHVVFDVRKGPMPHSGSALSSNSGYAPIEEK